MKTLFALFAAAALAGCATVKTSSEGGRVMVDAENNAWSILGLLPIGSGDVDRPNEQICDYFSDTVTLDNNLKMIRWAMRKKQAHDLRNVVSRTTDKSYVFILRQHTLRTSAELVP